MTKSGVCGSRWLARASTVCRARRGGSRRDRAHGGSRVPRRGDRRALDELQRRPERPVHRDADAGGLQTSVHNSVFAAFDANGNYTADILVVPGNLGNQRHGRALADRYAGLSDGERSRPGLRHARRHPTARRWHGLLRRWGRTYSQRPVDMGSHGLHQLRRLHRLWHLLGPDQLSHRPPHAPRPAGAQPAENRQQHARQPRQLRLLGYRDAEEQQRRRRNLPATSACAGAETPTETPTETATETPTPTETVPVEATATPTPPTTSPVDTRVRRRLRRERHGVSRRGDPRGQHRARTRRARLVSEGGSEQRRIPEHRRAGSRRGERRARLHVGRVIGDRSRLARKTGQVALPGNLRRGFLSLPGEVR